MLRSSAEAQKAAKRRPGRRIKKAKRKFSKACVKCLMAARENDTNANPSPMYIVEDDAGGARQNGVLIVAAGAAGFLTIS